ncbi:MAG TPA: ABC transporter permease, partial [Treponemataceae bacterium]|nr:ABC transporter permease [Treponemataceae bacterium]HOS34619.1 ABC transporter permease [Treponemataceae bacterium]HOU38409.1 ABC transporter permease [Treponemataceae bacterium]HQF73244.1 ABC transporter permease [Treponemataceae bacterium]
MKDSTSGGLGMLSVIAWRNIGRNRRRSILCITAVGIAVFFIIFMNSWMDGMFIGIENTVRTYETGHVLAVSEGFEAEKE